MMKKLATLDQFCRVILTGSLRSSLDRPLLRQNRPFQKGEAEDKFAF
jgi:hypothetical protein